MKRKINDEEIIFEEKQIHINELFFNPYNTRIESELAALKQSNEFQNTEDYLKKEFQDKIFEIFKNNKSTDKEAIVRSIKKEKGILEEMYITKNNIVLSGNNRLSILKELWDKNYEDVSYEVKVYVHPKENLSEQEIDELEIYLQMSGKEKEKYKEFEKMMKIHKMKFNYEKSDEELASIFNLEVKKIKESIDSINEYYSFLNYLGNNKYINLFNEADVLSQMQYLASNSFRKLSSELKESTRELLYLTSLTPFPFNKIRDISKEITKVDKKSKITTTEKSNKIKEISENIKIISNDYYERVRLLIETNSSIKKDRSLKEEKLKINVPEEVANIQVDVKRWKELNNDVQREYDLLIQEINHRISSINEIINKNSEKIFDDFRNKDKIESLEEHLSLIKAKFKEGF